MEKHEAHGATKKLTGRMKEAAGIVIGNKELEAKGARERAEGAVEENVGKARRKTGEFVNDVGKKIQGD